MESLSISKAKGKAESARFLVEDWGMIDYAQAWKRQREYLTQVQKRERLNTLILCEHPTVITLGRMSKPEHIRISQEEARRKGIPIVAIERGGDVTLHNPGQLVGYPIFHLSDFREDLHWFLRQIEESIIRMLRTFGITAGRVQGLTGVWIEQQRKICAIGIHASRWVTMHGFALNVQNDLSEFQYIVPCGIADRDVTSIEKELGRTVSMAEVKERTVAAFQTVFQ